jgi:hypothetical protein
LEEYARHFWARQETKNDPKDRDALADIKAGGDPVSQLGRRHDYKLPHRDNTVVRIVLLDQKDIENLFIHDYMPGDDWMRIRGLVPDPYTRKLWDLAGMFIKRGYFHGKWIDRQREYYDNWKCKGSLQDVIAGPERTLIQCVRQEEYEIVDGWARLLPFTVLLQQGYQFQPIETFVAWRPCDEP